MNELLFCTLVYPPIPKKTTSKLKWNTNGQQYPGCKCLSEIGSGLNFKRKKFIQLMEQVARKEVRKIVVGHKDRLCRFGFDFVEWFCNINDCSIEVLHNSTLSPHQELMQDFMSVMHCFSSKLYFRSEVYQEYPSRPRVDEWDKTD